MLSLYEILKASKTGLAPDMWTALAGMNWGGKDSGAEVKELTGIPPLSFTANRQPLLDYLISGNMTQTGTPTQQNPIQPQETEDRTGNLFDGDYQKAILSASGSSVTYYTVSSGRVAVVPCSPSTQYTAKKYGESNRFIIAESETKPSGGDTLSLIINNSALVEYTFTTGANTHYVAIYVSTSSEQAEPPLMLNSGSTALPYEPYGYKIPISSASTTTPVYLGEVQSTRRIYKYEFTGSETWSAGTENYYSLVPQTYGDGVPYSAIICSHCSNATINNTGKAVFFKKTDFPDITTGEELKQYCSNQYANGTPVCVWYVLATPTTGIVNEPLRKIGDYADTLSMEQAGVSIPTLNGQTVIDVDTTLKPSEMYIKYKG